MNIEYRISNVEGRNAKFRAPCPAVVLPLLCSCVLMHFIAGCESAGSPETSLSEQIENLRQEKFQLTRQLEQTQTENEQFKKRLHVLSGLPDEVKPESIYRLKRIKITQYTNLYDKDKDGTKEKLIVYIQPIDQDGDIIKAAGAVDVQLWDLNSPQANQAMLGQWHVEANELRKLWFATLITINYRLTFDVADKIDKFESAAGGLTVKVTFTDHLTGRVFKEQIVIKPR